MRRSESFARLPARARSIVDATWVAALFVGAVALGACSSNVTSELGGDPGSSGGSGDDNGGGGSSSDGGGATSSGGGGADGGAAGAKDAGPTKPSQAIGAPQIVSYGGPVMTAPRVVPVFYSGDAYAAQLTSFAQKLGASTYWGKATGEYGVGKIGAGTAVTLTGAAPTSITDTQIKSFLATQLDGAHALGTPDTSAIYTIYYPTSTSVTLDGYGASCQAFLGYHNETTVGGKKVVYAVVPRCSPPSSMSQIDELTVTTSHELVEASTDPYPMTDPAYAIPDNDHLVWALFPLSELGDMCAFNVGANVKPLDLGFMVQRSWSNLSALGGHHPCAPGNDGETYFIAVPELSDKVTIDFGGGQLVPSKGLSIPLHGSKTIDVALYADGASDAWQVQAVDLAQLYYQKPAELTFAIDHTSGKAGDHLKLTITRALAPSANGGSVFLLASTLGQKQNFWVGFVGN